MIISTNDLNSSNARFQDSRPGSVNVAPPIAKIMPPGSNPSANVKPVNLLNHSGITNENNFYGSRANKKQAPSTVTAEAYLAARISLRPVYIHNEIITRIQNVSNLSKDPPRFKDQVDLIA